jgi:glycylpeptide N-tetradecanoyltransferase
MTTLPDNFYWSSLDIYNPKELDQLYTLLSNHYVEDTQRTLRLNYSKEILVWALATPNYIKEWHVGVYYKDNNKNKLCAFISATPFTFNDGKTAFVNFLCVHKNIRTKRLAPVLIKEITRRIHLYDIKRAIYTGTKLKGEIAITTYWQRYLNPKKLIQHNIISLPHRMTLSRMIKLYRLTTKLLIRKMIPEDVSQVHILLNNYFKNTTLYCIWKEEDIVHWFLSSNHNTYILQQDNNIVAFFSYYCIDIKIVNTNNLLHTAYLFYCVVTNGIKMEDMIQEALYDAHKNGCDIFYCLDIMNNTDFLKPLKFIPNGKLHYYHTSCNILYPKEIGFTPI